MTDGGLPPAVSSTTTDNEVAPDAIQLMTIAAFNGICRLSASLAREGILVPHQLRSIHDAMLTPLDDPDWRDDEFVASARDTVDAIFAQAMKDAGSAFES